MTNTLRDVNYIYDDPVQYKTLMLHPVMLRDYFKFMVFADCFMLEKNSIPDVKIIQMSYLEYLYSVSNSENRLVEKFDALLKMAMKNDELKTYYGFDKKGIPYFTVDGVLYNSDDFEEIKVIVSEQNLIEYPDETIQKNVRDDIERARAIKQRLTNSKPAGLEEQIISLAIYTGWDMDKIYSLTFRKFKKSLRRANHIFMAKIYLQASMSGMVEFKDKSVLRSWLVELDDEEKNSDVIVGLEDLSTSINQGSTK